MNNHRLRAVVWDMGGVLLRTEDRKPRARLAESLGMTYETLDDLVFASESSKMAELGKISEQKHWEWVAGCFNLAPAELAQFRQAFWAGDRFDQELIDRIAALRPQYRTGLLSNAWSDTRQLVAGRSNLLEVFDVSLFSAEVGVAKPDARFYQMILERLEVSAAQAVFIDDVVRNVEGAQAAGMHAIHFQSPAQTMDHLQKLMNGLGQVS